MKEKLKQCLNVYGAPTLCLLVGLVFLFTGIGKAKKINVFPTVPAKIVNIEIIPGTADETDSYIVTVRYAVGGTTYESKTDDHKSGWQVGKQITVHYNPEKPHEIVTMSTGRAILIAVIGGSVAAVGAWLWIRLIREKAPAKQDVS